MVESLTFAGWLSRCSAQSLTAIGAARPDLLRTDATTLRALAALASSRAGAARGLLALDAASLRIVHAAAIASRVRPSVERSALLEAAALDSPADAEAALTAAIDACLLWPESPADAADPTAASAFRVQPEAASLLPVTAAERAVAPPWQTAADPRPFAVLRVSEAIAANAEAAGASRAVEAAFAVVGEFARREVSQLAGGGAGKRDVQALARAAGLDEAEAILLVELAAGLGWLNTTHDPVDPQWRPTQAFDAALAAPRERTWAGLLAQWLTRPADVCHLLAGRTPAGERVHPLGGPPKKRIHSGFPVGRSEILLLRRLVLTALLAAGEPGTAVESSALTAALAFDCPLLASATGEEVDEVLREAELLGLACAPLGHPSAAALTPLGAEAAAWIRDDLGGGDLLGDEELTEVAPPERLAARVAELLPELEERVVLQSDLTAVASGPLAPRTRGILERCAAVDTRGQGTVFRFDEESIGAALRAGADAASLRADLAEVSADGIPDQLALLIDDAARRLRRVQVSAARTVLVVDDPADLDILFAEPAAAAAGLRRISPTTAISAAPPERVSAYVETEDRPVLRPDAAAGTTRAPAAERPLPTRRQTARVPADQREAHIAALLETASAGASPTARAAEAASGLRTVLGDLREAAQAGAEVDVDIASSTGAMRTVRMTPRAMSAGRVRGLAARGEEITVPAARIVAVRAPGDPEATR